jgi:MarR family transcriptional regulator, transcriptional regulator for hemolysin
MTPLGQQLAQVAKLLRDRMDDELAAHGATVPMWLALLHIDRAPGLSQRDLAQAMNIEGNTLTHHLDRFEADGLVERHRSTRDRRVMELRLTRRGKRKVSELTTVMEAMDQRLRGAVSPADLPALNRSLSALRALLETPPPTS